MKRFIAFIFCIFPLLLLAQEVQKVAILETVDKEGNISYAHKLMLRSNLAKAVTNAPGYEAYDRTDMDAIMGEQNFQRTGMVSNEQIKRLGEMTGAAYIMVAEAVKVDEQNMFITAKILNVETAKTEATENVLVAFTSADIQYGCETLAYKLLGLSTAGIRPPTPPKQATSNKPQTRDVNPQTQVVSTENDKMDISIFAYGKPVVTWYAADHEFDGATVEYRAITKSNPNPDFEFLGTTPFAYMTEAEAKVMIGLNKELSGLVEIRPLSVDKDVVSIEFRLSKSGYNTVVVKPLIRIDFGGRVIMIPLNKLK